MEILIGLVIVAVIIFLIGNTIGQKSLDKPLDTWSDDELVRRLPKYHNLLSAQMKAEEYGKTSATSAKIKEIEAEIAKRQRLMVEQALLDKTENTLAAYGVPAEQLKSASRSLLDKAKHGAEEVYGKDLYAQNFGDKIIARGGKFISDRLSAGLTINDIREYWNQPPILNVLEGEIEDFRAFIVCDVARQQGQDEAKAFIQYRQTQPVYGDPSWDSAAPVNQGLTEIDARLYREFQLCVNRWVEKTSPEKMRETVGRYTSFNAMVRDLVLKKEI